jgi:hypothetical protein
LIEWKTIIILDNFEQLLVSEIAKLLLETAGHFESIHVIFENVTQPHEIIQNTDALRIYPFTPPCMAFLMLLTRFGVEILEEGFGSEFKFWFSTTNDETSRIVQKIAEGVVDWDRGFVTEFETNVFVINLA